MTGKFRSPQQRHAANATPLETDVGLEGDKISLLW